MKSSVRSAVPGDMHNVAELAALHAEYEKDDPPPSDLAERLAAALFGDGAPGLRCFVAELSGGELAGYATCAPEFATWQGRNYMHLDCLYLRETHRGLGLGARLMEAVIAEAASMGIEEVQWNTPTWNEGAIRFYDRLGSTRRQKQRYTLRLSPAAMRGSGAACRPVQAVADQPGPP
ncbi:GNAT family N-acetyltransferase [Streptomyces albidus (ex Kaewkla and Franco 2022)]|uniref:GNAT family N-acetyltransferase n=1 Tax=Streptomyces albidus (ex Kaewkla and Franco 2022) TaxID=722709 RepID=UPI0015EF82B0|nr:GNAT family N-acetyltransferase [Streptomyces albidus (ex Kaewkla and Franco 2022)]